MHYYRSKDSYLFSLEEYPDLELATEEKVASSDSTIYYLKAMPIMEARSCFSLSDATELYNKTEGLELLYKSNTSTIALPQWLQYKITNRNVTVLNTAYKKWQELVGLQPPKKWRINLAGLGDVGGTLLVGLRLLGGDSISSIGIYDRDISKVNRWEYEINQISDFQQTIRPTVAFVEYEDIFDCDMFVFCIAARVPAIGEEGIDVRMVQFEANAKIVTEYATLARQKGFKGVFAVVSDPVDPLCRVVLDACNRDSQGNLDYMGLAPEQIRGYGLGVMNARALYYAERNPELTHFKLEGRSYGPHGEDLIIADSIKNYNEDKSLLLTEKARTANLEVRKAGFKPYIAPALSSGALSILNTIRGEWHYSATFMGGVYMGAKNRLLPTGTEVEALELSPQLKERLIKTYNRLRSIV